MASEVGASFDEFVQGTGRLDDVAVKIQSARFSNWDYKGKIAQPVLALKLELMDGEGVLHEEYLSAGDLKFFVPSNDGKKAIPVGSQAKLNINTNAVQFLIDLLNADTKGEWAAKIKGTDDISVLDGGTIHVVQKAQPKRASISAVPGQENVTKTVLSVSKVLIYPWEAGKAAAPAAKAPAAGAAAPAAAAGPAPTGAAADAAGPILLGIVAEAGGEIKKQAIAGKVFGNPDVKAMTAAERNAILGIIVKDEFLLSEAVTSLGLVYANGVVKLG